MTAISGRARQDRLDHPCGVTRSSLLAAVTSLPDRSQSSGCAFPLTVIWSVRQPAAVAVVSGSRPAPAENFTRSGVNRAGRLRLSPGAAGSTFSCPDSRAITGDEVITSITECSLRFKTLAETITLRKL